MTFDEWTLSRPYMFVLRLGVILAGIWLIVAGVHLFQGAARKPIQASHEDFSFPAVAGLKTASGADLPGLQRADLAKGVTVLAVFGTWCPPCVREHPALMELAGKGVRVVGIATRDNETMVRGWLKEAGNPYQALGFDPTKHAWSVFGLQGIPTTLVFDAEGREVKRVLGELTSTVIADVLMPAVAAAETAKP